MISPKKLVKMARKWQSIASKGKKIVSFPGIDKPCLPEKGHFVVYTTDGKRFAIPLEYINSNIFSELLRMSEEEFGLSRNGPLVMPCDSVFMEYVVSIVQKGAAESLGNALLSSISSSQCLLYGSCQECKSQCVPILAY